MVEILQDFPSGFLDLVAGEYHVDAGLDGVFHLDGENAGMAVEILGLALEAVKAMGVLQIQGCDTSHRKTSL